MVEMRIGDLGMNIQESLKKELNHIDCLSEKMLMACKPATVAEKMQIRLHYVEGFDHVSGNGNNVNHFDVYNGSFMVARVFSKKAASRFIKAMEALPINNVETLVSLIWIVSHHDTEKSNSKLDGLQSISTSCLKNPICIARMKDLQSICAACYAATQQAREHGLDDENALNYFILNSVLIPDEFAAMVPVNTEYARIESFGDVSSVLQARNYIRIIRTHNRSFWGIWSKNIGIWAAAFEIEGKPENCTFVQSSKAQNVRENPEKPFIDHVFTVWESEEKAAENGIKITCGGRKCRTCLRCYRKDTGLYVD